MGKVPSLDNQITGAEAAEMISHNEVAPAPHYQGNLDLGVAVVRSLKGTA